MTLLLVVHVFAVGLWVGCIATETLFEHTLGTEPRHAAAVAKLHVAVDLWVEAPAFLVVALSGAALAMTMPLTPLLLVKMALGGAAVLINVACVWIVIERQRAFAAGAVGRAATLDLWQHRSGGLLVVFLAATLGCALAL